MQFSAEMNAVGTAVRSSLPERLLAAPGGALPRTGDVRRPWPAACDRPDRVRRCRAHSARGAKHIPQAEVRLLGGVIYHAALNDVFANFTEEDAPLLKVLLILDEQLAARGLTHYGAAWAVC
jgi:hypothetical protein